LKREPAKSAINAIIATMITPTNNFMNNLQEL
jgi:hypothetical protein